MSTTNASPAPESGVPAAPGVAARPSRAWRGWVAAATLLILLVTGVIVGESAGWPFLRTPLQRAIERAATVPVQLNGDFHVRLFGKPRLQVGQLQVGAGGGLPLPHLMHARDVELAWRWADLSHWRQGGMLRIERLQVGAIDARLHRLADGRASWQIGAAPAATTGSTPPSGDPLDVLPQFGTLLIERGTIELDDQLQQTQLRIDVAVRDDDTAAALTGYSARIAGRWRALPLRLEAQSGSPLPLIDEGSAPAAVPLQVQGVAGDTQLSFNGRAAALLGPRRLEGAIRLRGPSLARAAKPLGVTLPDTPPFDISGDIVHNGGLWKLRVAKAQIGRSRLAGEFEFDSRLQPRRLQGRLWGPLLLLTDLGPAIGTPGPAGQAAPPAGRVLPHRRFDLPSLRAMDADVEISIDRLEFGTQKVMPLRPVRTRLLLGDGVLQLQSLQVGQGASGVTGTMLLDARTEPARWAADLEFSAAEIANWLPVLRGSATRRGANGAPAPPYLTGRLIGRLDVVGTGRSTAEILATLHGRARLALRDGTMSHLATEAAGLDIAQGLGVLIRGDKPLPLRCAQLDLAIEGGIVRPRVAVVDNPDTRIRIDGQVDLRNEALALRATVQPKDTSLLALRAPILVTGTLADPVVGIEGGRLAGRAIGALTLGAAFAPLAALIALIDRGRTPEEPCSVEAAAPGPAASTAARPR